MFRQLLRLSFAPAITSFACVVTIACVALPADAFAQNASEDRPPTPLEQTLVEHVCDRFQTSAQNPDVREQCVGVQFGALRAEFGYDLSRLSSAERARLDSTCSRLRKPENVEPYLNCLTALLVSVREQRHGANGVAPSEVSFGIPTMPASAPAPPPPSHRSWPIVLTLFGVIAAAAGAGIAVMRMKKRPAAPSRVCQRCGEPLQASGDLCSSCRHEAGVAAKQAIADRAAEERAEHERKKREREQAEERQRQLEAHAAEQQRLEEARVQAERDRRQAELEMPPIPIPVVAAIGADVDDTAADADPYSVLGVPRDASREQIEKAYTTAASKYDATQVAHLGDAVQAHYREKAEAIEQAYRTLTGQQLTTTVD
ncbi:MAG TPA: DnaJ domain-containing protein [Vicinamibacterales bacterium]|nr:DnaJ domain-containing protein [Vicinamibacterales bacterium]